MLEDPKICHFGYFRVLGSHGFPSKPETAHVGRSACLVQLETRGCEHLHGIVIKVEYSQHQPIS